MRPNACHHAYTIAKGPTILGLLTRIAMHLNGTIIADGPGGSPNALGLQAELALEPRFRSYPVVGQP